MPDAHLRDLALAAATEDWGPADWQAVVGGAITLLFVVGWLFWQISDPYHWGGMRDTFRKPPPADPRDKVPYKRPDRPTPEGKS